MVKTIRQCKRFFRLMLLFKTPFISCKGNTWRIVNPSITRHYFSSVEKLMEEGYKVMAEEHKEFARLSAKAASEVVPPWD